jgi:hypothetical protein
MKLIYACLAILSFNLQASSVLFIGDSHSVGPFGRSMDQHLRGVGFTVNTFASCGSIAQWWKTGKKTPCGYFSHTQDGTLVDIKVHATPDIDLLLSELRPRVVIVELGGNYASVSSQDFVRTDIDSLVSSIINSGAQCFWITNPDTRNNRAAIPRILRLIRAGVAERCPIFESYRVTKYPETGGDGVHYSFPQGSPIAKAWAKAAFEHFIEHFPH